MAKRIKEVRGERRYVEVADNAGNVYRVLTSLAAVNWVLIETQPSNLDRAGALGGMLITHDTRVKAHVFNNKQDMHDFITHMRRMETTQGCAAHHRSIFSVGSLR